MGFWRSLVVFHVVSASLLLCGVGYVFLLPRLLSPDLRISVANGGISSSSFVVHWNAPPPVACAKEPCEGAWVKVAWKPLLPTAEEEAELNKLEDKRFDSGYFRGKFDEGYNVDVPLTNLRPDTEYSYSALMQVGMGARGEVFRSTFRTLAAPMAETKPFSFVFGSCLMSRSQPFETVDLIDPLGVVFSTEPKPRFAMLLGDSVYLDAPYRLEPAQAYIQLMENLAFRRLVFNFPTFFGLDDHEIRNDADDVQSPEFLNATRAWDLYLGRRNSPSRGRTVSFWHGQTAFLMLDTRSQRSPKTAADDGRKTMLGEAQLQMLKEWAVETSQARIRFLISPVPWSASVKSGDGWRLYQKEREQVLDLLEQHKGVKTVLLSGDLHFGLIAEIRKGMFEISASPISSLPLLAKVGTPVLGEKIVWTNQLKQHVGRIDVGANASSAVVSVYSEIPGLGTKLAIKMEI